MYGFTTVAACYRQATRGLIDVCRSKVRSKVVELLQGGSGASDSSGSGRAARFYFQHLPREETPTAGAPAAELLRQSCHVVFVVPQYSIPVHPSVLLQQSTVPVSSRRNFELDGVSALVVECVTHFLN